MSFKVIIGDITKAEVDVIVNAANNQLQRGGGVCGAIYKAAGARELTKECKELAPVQTGEAVITNAGKLPCKKIIHAVGPVYVGGFQGEPFYLRLCYRNALLLAAQYSYKTVAFPLISAGAYGYPPHKAFKDAAFAINNFLNEQHKYYNKSFEVSMYIKDKALYKLIADSGLLTEAKWDNYEEYEGNDEFEHKQHSR
jgi:O-acetyl-ADP-ribose deacetylase (regulator of RNase III)